MPTYDGQEYDVVPIPTRETTKEKPAASTPRKRKAQVFRAEDKAEIGRMIHEGLTHTQIAEQTGWSLSAVARNAPRRRLPEIEEDPAPKPQPERREAPLQALAAALGMEPGEILRKLGE